MISPTRKALSRKAAMERLGDEIEQGLTQNLSDAEYKKLSALYEQASLEIARKNCLLSSQRTEIDALKSELSDLKVRNQSLESSVRKISAIIGELPE